MPRRLCMIVLTAVAPLAAAERIELFTFENADGANLSGVDLWVDIIDQGTRADFVFHNDSTVPSFVRSIYIEGTPFSKAVLENGHIERPQQEGVYFRKGYATPAKPPGAISHFGGAWQGNVFMAGAKRGGTNKDGLDPGEQLVVQFDYEGTFSQLVTGLRGESPAFRIVQHVQGIGGSSVWNMNDRNTVVPLPSGAGLALAGLGLVAARRRR